jgi:hypothetical protein
MAKEGREGERGVGQQKGRVGKEGNERIRGASRGVRKRAEGAQKEGKRGRGDVERDRG